MNRVVFAADLDNTLIYSRKHIGSTEAFHCIEQLDGKEQGFISRKTEEYLRDICQKLSFLPVTTRSMAQYQRIQWPEDCVPALALTANGAILLEHGKVDLDWWKESRRYIEHFASELERLQERLRFTEAFHRCRMVDDSYLFIPCDASSDITVAKQEIQELTTLSVQASGRKLYALPHGIDKGTAIQRLKRRFHISKVISAGDSMMDIPMLQQADVAFSPSELLWQPSGCKHLQRFVYQETGQDDLFSDYVLQSICRMIPPIHDFII